MSYYTSLQHIFLISMPQLTDAQFSQSVIYLWEYNAQGAAGVIINKPMNIHLGELLQQLQIDVTEARVDHYPVLQGGPVAADQGFIIRRRYRHEPDARNPVVEITVSSSKQDLVELARGEGLGDSLVALGCAGWTAGQLDKELANNDWLVVPFNEEILFGTQFNASGVSFAEKWYHAAAIVGIDLNRLSSDVGHA